MVYKNAHIKLVVKQLKQNNAHCKSIVFKRPSGFNYEAGDWVDIDFADTSDKGGKTYSFSSSPTETELVISFRRGISPFKKMLQTAQPGNEMYVSQYGNGYNFQLHNNRSSVLIAGGIGIAPFRSLVKEMYDMRGNNNVRLIYLNKDESFLFRDEFEEWQRKLANFKTDYIMTNELKLKSREKLLRSIITNTAQNFYIAGPSGMVKATAELLAIVGVAPKDIRIDDFGNY